MIDEKQADAAAAEDVADAKVITPEQVWDEITGQDTSQDDTETTSSDAEVDAESAATDDDNPETAENAVQDENADGNGEDPGKQDNDGAIQNKRLLGQVSGQARKISELQRKIANFSDDQSSGEESRTSENLAELQEEYPDIVGPLLTQQTAMQERMDLMSSQLSKMSELQGAQIKASEEIEGDKLEQSHPDWFGYLQENGADFTAWVDDQPASVRAIASSNMERVVDSEGVASLISSFKAHQAGDPPEQNAPEGADLKRDMTSKRKRQLAGARSVPTRGNQSVVTEARADETDADAIWGNITKNA